MVVTGIFLFLRQFVTHTPHHAFVVSGVCAIEAGRTLVEHVHSSHCLGWGWGWGTFSTGDQHLSGGLGCRLGGTELTGTPSWAIYLHKSEEQRQNLSRS